MSHVIDMTTSPSYPVTECFFSERLVLNVFCLAQKMWVVENMFWMHFHYDTTFSHHDTYLGVMME